MTRWDIAFPAGPRYDRHIKMQNFYADWKGAFNMKWGILATGVIARKFADTINQMPGESLAAVGSRTLEQAKACLLYTSLLQ